jgi:hypothetical protein
MKEIVISIKKNLMLTVFILELLAINIYAQEIPANLQAALFKKIFSFDKTLTSKGIEVAVLGASGDAIVSAFKEAGINAKAVSGNQVPGDVSVVYIMAGTASTKQQSASKGILSISGTVSLVESGQVAIGLTTEGGKPKIVIHMAQLKAEEQELSADLLKLAKVIQ